MLILRGSNNRAAQMLGFKHVLGSPAPGGVGTALAPATIELTSGKTTYPPTFRFTRPAEWAQAEGVKAVMRWRPDPTLTTGIVEGPVVTITADVDDYDFGLSAITSGSEFLEMLAWTGTRPADNLMLPSNIINVGDVTAPTITTSTAVSGSQSAAGSTILTASEKIKTWAISGGADSASFTLTPLTATTAQLSWGAFSTAGTRNVSVTATDYADNTSLSWNGVVSIVGPVALDPTHTSSYLTLVSSNTAYMNVLANAGATAWTRATLPSPGGKNYFEAKIDPSSSSDTLVVTIGLQTPDMATQWTNHSDIVSCNTAVSTHNNQFDDGGNGWWNAFNGYTPVPGDVIQMAYDETTELAWFGVNNTWKYDPVEEVNGVPFTMPASAYACFGVYVREVQYKVIPHFSAATQVYAPPSGFLPYDRG